MIEIKAKHRSCPFLNFLVPGKGIALGDCNINCALNILGECVFIMIYRNQMETIAQIQDLKRFIQKRFENI